MIDFKDTLFTRIVAIIIVTLVICFVIAASAMMFSNPEYILAAKKVIVAGGAIGLFFAALMIAFNIAELLFAGAIAVIVMIGAAIVEGWKKLTKVDTIGDE